MLRKIAAGLVLMVPLACGCGGSSEPSAVETDDIANFLESNPELNNNDDPDPDSTTEQ